MDQDLIRLNEFDTIIQKIAISFGLDYFPQEFDSIPAQKMLEIMSYHFPVNFSHWSFGRDYEMERTRYEYGYGVPYEVVLNSNPSRAYLMNTNPFSVQVMVMAHVYAHNDFMKNNIYFKPTRRDIIASASGATTRFQEYEKKFGLDKVERIIDAGSSIEMNVDPDFFIVEEDEEQQLERLKTPLAKPETPGQFADLIGGKKAIEACDKGLDKTPLEPDRDILLYIQNHSPKPLKDWEKDVLSVLRGQSRYFFPQRRTKIMNEGWACVTGDTLIDTKDGLFIAKELFNDRIGVIFDGENYNNIIDFHHNPSSNRIKITTNNGYCIHGGEHHKILVFENWKELKNLSIGDKLPIMVGNDTWPDNEVKLTNHKFRQFTQEICDEHKVSYRQVRKHIKGKIHKVNINNMIDCIDALKQNKKLFWKNNNVKFPDTLNEKLANILGVLIGDGVFYYRGSGKRISTGFTTGDAEIGNLFAKNIEDVFNIDVSIKNEPTKWRFDIPIAAVNFWLVNEFGFHVGNTASIKFVPKQILKSPRNVVIAFLRGLFDTDGCATKTGCVIYTTASEILAKQIHDILLKFGIVSRLSKHTSKNVKHKDGYRIEIFGIDAEIYRTQIGFNLSRKQKRLDDFNNGKRKWFKKNRNEMKIVSIEHDIGEVYDFTIANSHKYRASAFINHNSYWHTKIMNKLFEDGHLSQEDHGYFNLYNARVLASNPKMMNPYLIGLKMFEDVEDRWNKGRFGREWEDCCDSKQKEEWDFHTNQGRQKIFDVRRNYSDRFFIEHFLTEKIVEDLQLYLYEGHLKGDSIDYEITTKDWKTLRKILVSHLSSFGCPIVYVEDGDYKGRRELYLKHAYDGIELDKEYREKTLENIYYLWNRPIHLESKIEGDRDIIYVFDGGSHSVRSTLETNIGVKIRF